jgi:hypothetical protein
MRSSSASRQSRSADMGQDQINLAIRLLREQEVTRSIKNAAIRKTFGARITTALGQECDQRDREIDALNATILLLETQS